MNWTFHPKNKKLTTSLPMSIELDQVEGKPSVSIEGIGQLELKATKAGKLKADFYVTLPGSYKMTIQDKNTLVHYPINVEQHSYLDFQNEFGVFFLLFLMVMGGIIIWTRKIMRNKTV